MPILTLAELDRLYSNEKMIDQTARGVNITTGLGEANFNSGTWPLTFNNDFNNVAGTVLPYADPNPYVANKVWTKGYYGSGGIGSMVGIEYDPGVAPNTLYYQGAPSELWLGCGKFGGSIKQSIIESLRQRPGTNAHSVEDGVTEISEGHKAMYGMWEAKCKLPPTFRPDCAITWPAFWLYNDRWNCPSRPTMEIDQFEMYIGSANNVSRQDGSYHQSMHQHNTQTSLLNPGYISKDGFSSNILGVSSGLAPTWPEFANPAYEWGDEFHRFQFYIGPEFMFSAMDDKVISKYSTLDAYHQGYQMLVQHWVNSNVTGTGAKLGINGLIEGQIIWMAVDWLRHYQNPDWVGLTLAGSANALTVTTGLPMVGAYADGRYLSCTSFAPNTTTTPTLNANGLGAKVIKKYSDFANNGPWTGALIALAPGDIVGGGGRVNFRYSAAGNCWILLNPEREFVFSPKVHVPPAYTVPPVVIDVERVEGIIMTRWNQLQLLPDEHTGKAQPVDPNLVQPRVVPNRSYTTVVSKLPGDLVGTCAINNTPTFPARASWSGSPNFTVNPANGSILIAEGAGLLEGVETGEVSFWSPGIPQIRGANVCKCTITIQPNVPFDIPAFFGANLGASWEIDITETVGLNGSTIATVGDRSGFAHNLSQTIATVQPSYDPVGLNGHPCLVSTLATDRMDMAGLPPNTPANAFGAVYLYNDNTVGVKLNSVARKTEAGFDFTVPHSLYFEWNSVEVFCWVNGSPVTVLQQAGLIPSSGWVFLVAAWSVPTASVGHIYDANESNARILLTISGSAGVNGKFGIMAIGKTANTPTGRDKLIGSGHWRYGLQSLLPAGHPYKSEQPYLYG